MLHHAADDVEGTLDTHTHKLQDVNHATSSELRKLNGRMTAMHAKTLHEQTTSIHSISQWVLKMRMHVSYMQRQHLSPQCPSRSRPATRSPPQDAAADEINIVDAQSHRPVQLFEKDMMRRSSAGSS